MIEESPDHPTSRRIGPREPRFDREVIGDPGAIALGREGALVSPSPLKPRGGLLDESGPGVHRLQAQRVSIERQDSAGQ